MIKNENMGYINRYINYSKNNIEKIENLYNEMYWNIFSKEEIFERLDKDVNALSDYKEYTFFYKNKEMSPFDVFVTRKNIDGLWYMYNYNDNITLWEKLKKMSVIDINGNELSRNEIIDLPNILWKYIQKNLFLSLFRSLLVSHQNDIINVFNLRFFNKFEIESMSKEDKFFEKYSLLLENKDVLYQEKVDWQLLMIYKYNSDIVLQTKNSAITVDNIMNNKLVEWTVFAYLYKLIYDNGYDFKEYLTSIIYRYPNIVYHFEFLRNKKPIVQEYNNVWLFLLWWKYLSSMKDITYWNPENNYNCLYDTFDENLIESKIMHNIVMWKDLDKVVKEIKRKRCPDEYIDDYVIEWLIERNNNALFKIKTDEYFIVKLLNSFSEKNSAVTLGNIEKLINTKEDTEKLITVFNEVLIKDSQIIYHNENINKLLNKIKWLNKNRKTKISIIRFLKYIDKEYENNELKEQLINNIIYDKEEFLLCYKDFLVNSMIWVISNMLSNDTEELSLVEKLLWIDFSQKKEEQHMWSFIKREILRKLDDKELDTFLINRIYNISVDIYNI